MILDLAGAVLSTEIKAGHNVERPLIGSFVSILAYQTYLFYELPLYSGKNVWM